MKSDYINQVQLLLSILPLVMEDPRFALKGGTAINLFIRDLPRLSVDLDLTYLPIEPRETSLSHIQGGMRDMQRRIKTAFRALTAEISSTSKLAVSNPDAKVKVEPNTVLRGSVFPCETRELSKAAQEMFEMRVSAHCMSFADIYAGKICAALDRQHPRDLFDIKLLLANEGLSDDTRKAFVLYLAGHNRPMNELLSPSLLDFSSIFNSDFAGMTREPVTCQELNNARAQLVSLVQTSLTKPERRFLLSLKAGEPEWDLLAIAGIEKLPWLQWKLRNVRLMESGKRKRALKKLADILET